MSLVISRLAYALSALGGFLKQHPVLKIDGVIFCENILNIKYGGASYTYIELYQYSTGKLVKSEVSTGIDRMGFCQKLFDLVIPYNKQIFRMF